MTTKRKYSCFFCPRKDYSTKSLTDLCPDCGHAYGFPLQNPPSEVDRYSIEGPIARGFYSATFVATYGALSTRVVLKVCPVSVYKHFDKDFDAECRLHKDVAGGTDHIVDIVDALEPTTIRFGKEEVECHVAVLRHIEGLSLRQFMDTEDCSATAVTQITIDLFNLLSDLEGRQKKHNDLHDENIIIERLPPQRARAAGSVDESIRAVAIDLGSAADESLSGDGSHTGDIAFVSSYLHRFVEHLLGDPDATADVDYRVASMLDGVAFTLSTNAANQRHPDFRDYADQVRSTFVYATSPWTTPPSLSRFNDSYNAQTMHPWYVPRLLVDPSGQWLQAVEVNGPQVIVGMRGCGKTMLLRALQLHSRLSAEDLTPSELIEALRSRPHFGIYVSCTRLLDITGDGSLHAPYARLFLAYAREAIRALHHLVETSAKDVSPGYWGRVCEVVSSYVSGVGTMSDIGSATIAERRLQEMLSKLDRGHAPYELTAHPSVAFPALAEAILDCSPVFGGGQVFFLLDDASTRHLKVDDIKTLFGQLMFSNEKCAFKVTTEMQTFEMILRSPGMIEKAREGRDYSSFDLGTEIIDRIRNGHGTAFIESVLAQRARYYPNAPTGTAKGLLGDCSLEDIARQISTTSSTARERKSVYWGISALTAICVGDIGDVITIYGDMLKRVGPAAMTIPPNIQSQSFQTYCSRRLYHLNRRGGELKDFALSFAGAAHDLLIRSRQTASKAERPSPARLRQYTHLYVRVAPEEADAHFDRILALLDAGIFVLKGGADSPRTKTRDSNPVQQFILTYRKLFGLSSFMGIADRDRFELSSADMAEWLDNPSKGKEILMRRLGGPVTGDERALPGGDVEAATDTGDNVEDDVECQMSFDDLAAGESHSTRSAGEIEGWSEVVDNAVTASSDRSPSIDEVALESLRGMSIGTLVVGLGFEERTVESLRRTLRACEPKRVIGVTYDEVGRGEEMRLILSDGGLVAQEVRHDAPHSWGDATGDGIPAIDVTGLTKRAIFEYVRRSLGQAGEIIVIHTLADAYYPLNEDIETVFSADDSCGGHELLEAARGILTGESGPYHFENLLESHPDDSRRRLLCAAASPKHERLLSLLDERQFDRVEVITSSSQTPRSRLSRLAAEVAANSVPEANTLAVNSNDVSGLLSVVFGRAHEFYVGGGFEVEIGLTGSKMHAVACGAAATASKFSAVWYVRPETFDEKRFTRGVAATQVFRIRASEREYGALQVPGQLS